ncbi:MAG: DUF4252 domain-containing protein [Saprospiraceae bacterium]|nr:DUF4252 domain-containing protein [Saprospiraceae bacterium]
MNKLLSLALLLFLSFSATAQVDAIDRFFEQYQENEEFTMVFVSPKMFGMAAKVAGDEMGPELKNLIEDLKGLKILKTEVNALQVYKDAVKKIPTNEYEILMTARDDGQNVKILTKTKGDDVIEELLLLVGGKDEFVLVSFVGNINLNDLAKIAGQLDIDGMKHLEKIGQD